jgi:Domain of unknown function (DUF4377)
MNYFKPLLKAFAASAVFLIILQCKTTSNMSNEKTIMVASQTADCTGVAPMKCLQIKEKESDNWEMMYTNIEGFTYEPGFEYTLKIKTEKIENPPMDGSSIRYILLKQISKVKK